MKKHKFLREIDLNHNISYHQNLEINVFIKNPTTASIKPELEVKYPSGWSTSNRYVRSNDKIPIGYITAGNIEKYSIEFTPSYSVRGKQSEFSFNLYVNGVIVDNQEEFVYVR